MFEVDTYGSEEESALLVHVVVVVTEAREHDTKLLHCDVAGR